MDLINNIIKHTDFQIVEIGKTVCFPPEDDFIQRDVLFTTSSHQTPSKPVNYSCLKRVTLLQLSGPLSLDFLSRMDFLGKVVKESARKRPVMVISTPEYVTCSMAIGDFHSPPGVRALQGFIVTQSLNTKLEFRDVKSTSLENSRGFIQGRALRKLTGCEKDFARLVQQPRGKFFLQRSSV